MICLFGKLFTMDGRIWCEGEAPGWVSCSILTYRHGCSTEVEEIVATAAKWDTRRLPSQTTRNVSHYTAIRQPKSIQWSMVWKANIVEDRVPIVYNEVEMDLSEAIYSLCVKRRAFNIYQWLDSDLASKMWGISYQIDRLSIRAFLVSLTMTGLVNHQTTRTSFKIPKFFMRYSSRLPNPTDVGFIDTNWAIAGLQDRSMIDPAGLQIYRLWQSWLDWPSVLGNEHPLLHDAKLWFIYHHQSGRKNMDMMIKLDLTMIWLVRFL